MKVIIHIGTEKTGTSSIQLFLRKNRKALREKGYHYLMSAGAENHWALPAYCSEGSSFNDFYRLQSLETDEQLATFRREFLQHFDNEVRSLPADIHTVLISSEHFHSRLRTEVEMLNLKNLLGKYFSDIRVLCYLREQGDTCESWYSTSMKSGATYSFYEFLRRCQPQSYYFNYYDVLTNWARFFGRTSIEAALFDRGHFVGGNLLVDFANRIEPGIAAALDTTTRNVNESLTPMGQALIRALNIHFPVGDIDEADQIVRRACQDVIVKTMTGKGQRMTFQRRQKIYESFLESNEKVQRDYFPLNSLLFRPPEKRDADASAVGRDFLQALSSLFKVIEGQKKRHFSPADYESFWRAIIASVRDVVEVRDEVTQGAVEVFLTEDDGRLLRRAAMQMEWSDTRSAHRLMTLADAVAPGLPGIRQKLAHYIETQEEQVSGVLDHAFVMVFQGTSGDAEREVAPETAQRFTDWALSLNVQSGNDLIVPLSQISKIVFGGVSEPVAGTRIKAYTVFKARSMQEAIEIAESCPQLEPGSSLEVFKVETL